MQEQISSKFWSWC